MDLPIMRVVKRAPPVSGIVKQRIEGAIVRALGENAGSLDAEELSRIVSEETDSPAKTVRAVMRMMIEKKQLRVGRAFQLEKAA